MDGGAAAGGLGADQVKLVLGPVDQASHFAVALGRGRSARCPWRPPGGAMTPERAEASRHRQQPGHQLRTSGSVHVHAVVIDLFEVFRERKRPR
jgi:hypothetical protein